MATLAAPFAGQKGLTAPRGVATVCRGSVEWGMPLLTPWVDEVEEARLLANPLLWREPEWGSRVQPMVAFRVLGGVG